MKEGFAVASNPEMKFHYIKAPQYSEFPMHGVFGGVTTNGQISMAIFSERIPLPKVLTNELTPVEDDPGAYQLTSEKREGLDGVVRFVHNNYYFDLNMAKALRDWLDDKIGTIEGLTHA
ncbi:hypothetical protein [Sphingobium yanoikuyae]|uniref:Uncharacterized protein n=1 Tax=Sphingobium yanoikuyae TaxID=13690 RepID=A0A0J9D499_SPHYA|nr:hypothetical protein [Sphingobium yanoikuyae]ATP19772.1 hypothetical protein BV87_16125 [Sphingobium yanoikuyae]KMW31964.1 hypothetical protein BV87_20950 [Sphingobium yanoikuyae]